jgi:soluble lytic murein transglycosylase-like protein
VTGMAQGADLAGAVGAGATSPAAAPPVPSTGYTLFPSLVSLVSGVQATPATVGSGPGFGPMTTLGSTTAMQGSAAPAQGAQPPADIAALIDQVAAAHGLPPNLLTALVRQESGFDPNAKSPVGAMGLTQLMPSTAASLGVQNPWDPVENLNGGATYLAGLLKSYNGNVQLALAAYNAGPGAVQKWGGVPPYPETQAYVRNIMALSGLKST